MTQASGPNVWAQKLSLWRITRLYRREVSITWTLLVLEACLILLFPLAIGFAVDTLADDQNEGLIVLGVLSVAVLIIGAGRRFYDTRAYAGIYEKLANALVAYERQRQASASTVTARTRLLYEVVEFLENDLPSLLSHVISFFGVLIVVGLMDRSVLLICLTASVLIAVVYAVSRSRIYAFNQSQNDELERQVTVLSQHRPRPVAVHFKRMMKWNIKLSDLETINFSLIWVVLGTVLLASVYLIANNPLLSFGNKITAIMYVFQYIEVVMAFPLFYQQWVRLSEIMQRLA